MYQDGDFRFEYVPRVVCLVSSLTTVMERTFKIAELKGDEKSGGKSRTFVFQDEGHTLGNALRCIIVRYPEVTFCGYSIPHPAESRMHFRIQTTGPKAIDILRRGLADLEKLCDHTLDLFQMEVEAFKEST